MYPHVLTFITYISEFYAPQIYENETLKHDHDLRLDDT